MTVYFDLLGAQNRDHGERGIARLISQLVLATEREHPDYIDRYIVHSHLPIPESLELLIGGGKLVRSDAVTARPSDGGVFIAGSVMELEESLLTVLPHWARGEGWKRLAVLYDLIPLRFADEYLGDPVLKAKYLDRVAAYGMFDHLLPISQTSRDDAAELIGFPSERQTVIYAGVDERFRPAAADAVLPDVEGLRPEYVLFPTGIDWRKNVDRTIDAYGALPAELRAQHQLVLATRLDPWMVDALQDKAAAAGLERGQMLLPGYLPDDELVRLYQHALVAIFPSLYEGFGLPAVEAMRCGVPVLVADNSSLREVQPNVAARFDGTSTSSITQALQRALTDPTHRRSVLDAQKPNFTWERSAGLMVEALSQQRQEPTRPRIAVVTPLPPQPSGIANYSSRLLPELAKLADVTAFTAVNAEEGDVEFEELPSCEIRPLAELELLHHGGQPFDRIVYMMGNSRFHVEALKSLRRTGGVVVFHDARYTSLYNELYRIDPSSLGAAFVGEKLKQMYPERYRPAVVAAHTIEADEATRFGILMASEIAGLASDRFCHSNYAAAMLQLDTGFVFEHAFDLPIPEPVRASAGRASNVVAAFGIVDPSKSPELLIEACGLLAARDVVLRFVGDCDASYQAALEQAAAANGVEVEFTGFVSEAELLHHQRTVTLAVQLRRYSNGESSGALAELISAGTPTVTTAIGAFADLPGDALAFVESNPSAAQLAAVVAAVVNDPHRQLSMAEAAERYAGSNSYGHAARTLAERLGLRA